MLTLRYLRKIHVEMYLLITIKFLTNILAISCKSFPFLYKCQKKFIIPHIMIKLFFPNFDKWQTTLKDNFSTKTSINCLHTYSRV